MTSKILANPQISFLSSLFNVQLNYKKGNLTKGYVKVFHTYISFLNWNTCWAHLLAWVLVDTRHRLVSGSFSRVSLQLHEYKIDGMYYMVKLYDFIKQSNILASLTSAKEVLTANFKTLKKGFNLDLLTQWV